MCALLGALRNEMFFGNEITGEAELLDHYVYCCLLLSCCCMDGVYVFLRFEDVMVVMVQV